MRSSRISASAQAFRSGDEPATWVEAIKCHPAPLGTPDPSAFVVPRSWVKRNYKDKAKHGRCPDQLEQMFTGAEVACTRHWRERA
jgi:hypothetical protein